MAEAPQTSSTSQTSSADAGKVSITYDEIPHLQGRPFGPSSWKEITQAEIDAFAHLTGDLNPVHVDPDFAAETSYGTTIAHGFLTLSLVVPLIDEVFEVSGVGLGINYGLNRLRFPAAVPVGSRIRVRGVISEVGEVPGGYQFVQSLTWEREGGEKPVAIADLVVRYYR